MKNNEIISFRPTPEVSELIQSVRERYQSVSAWINRCVLAAQQVGEGNATSQQRFLFRFIPEEGREHFLADSGEVDPQKVSYNSQSVSRLNLRAYDRFRQCLQRDGLQFFSRNIPHHGVVQMVAVNQVEANVEFQRFFQLQPDDTYTRTALPLPSMRYDGRTDTAIIVYIEPS